MLTLILASLYFILPAYIANMMPPIAAIISPRKNSPVSIRLFGSHKTFRGFYSAYVGAFIALVIQILLTKNNIFTQYALLNYESINIFLYAFLFGIGAMTGDLIKSFIKRRLKIAPGRPFPPFDQLDFILGALLFLAPFYILPWQNIITILIATPILHFASNILGWLLKIKKVWW